MKIKKFPANMTNTGLASQCEAIEHPPFKQNKCYSPFKVEIDLDLLYGDPSDPMVPMYSKVVTDFILASWTIFLKNKFGVEFDLYSLLINDVEESIPGDIKTVNEEVNKKSTKADKMNQTLRDKGLTSVEVAAVYINLICYWIYIHGFSTSTLINLLIGRNAGSYAKKMVKRGFLRKTKTTAGAFKRDFPAEIYTLTPLGLQTAREYSGADYPYDEVNSNKIPNGARGSDLRHGVVIQRSIIHLMGLIDGYMPDGYKKYTSERMWIADSGMKKQKGIKLFDAIFKFSPSTDFWHILMIEIELSIKGLHTEAFYQFCKMIVDAIQKESGISTHAIILTDKEGIFNQYRKVLVEGYPIKIWENGCATNRSFLIPESVRKLISVRMMDAGDPGECLSKYLDDTFLMDD